MSKNKYVYVSDKYKTLDIKWDTGYQYYTFRVSVDDLLDINAEIDWTFKKRKKKPKSNNKEKINAEI
tara:strand:- start:2036 stop:2236 length:201 start_codon:yes stop_codon:yes gene_type:complete